MDRSAAGPPEAALAEVRRLAGPGSAIRSIERLPGGQHAQTWLVETEEPETGVVVRRFPPGDRAGGHEVRVLGMLDGLGGLAPKLLGADLDGRWSESPTTLISRLDGEAEIAPADPVGWARELGRGLAAVHSFPSGRVAELPSVGGELGGPEVLTHTDYWSGNCVFRDGELTGIVDWSGASRGPRGYDVSWCRLDLVLLFDERIAREFLAAYESHSGCPLENVRRWDLAAAARSRESVATWGPNYMPLGRPDLDADELQRRHAEWTAHLMARGDLG